MYFPTFMLLWKRSYEKQLRKEWCDGEPRYYPKQYRNEHAYYVGDNYIIKAFVNLGSLKNHVSISKSLENLGISAATPIKTVNGMEFIQDGQLYFILTERLQGEPMKALDMY